MLKSHDATSLSVLKEEKEVAEERREESLSSPQA